MWKEVLPEKCPPDNAEEGDMEVFRILKGDTPIEDDFKCYAKISPRYVKICEAHAVSFYNSASNAISTRNKKLKRDGGNMGDYIGKYKIEKKDGKNVISNKTGHISTWFYATWDFNNFKPESVVQINAD